MSKEVNWQQECLKKGFEYVREPDDHYVVASPAEMVALLRDLLGVDVRTKDCDSYGVAVCELQEQIDGLVNTIHAQQAEREALLAERDRMEKDAVRFREIVAAVVREHPHRSASRGNAPGHGHSLPGVWDSDNGALAGTECAWCKTWNEAIAALQGAQP